MVEFLESTTNQNNFSNAVEEAVYYTKKLLTYVDNVIITMGKHGVMVGRKRGSALDEFLNIPQTPASESPQQIRHYKSPDVSHIESVSGAGDCFASGFIAALLAGKSENICVSVGFAAAKMALQTRSPVPDKLFGQDHEAWKTPVDYKTFH
ncbi:unnamed protein product [Acanthoscelides obtectus]|uniref:Carbohydrate kinase PfkB domain-containing protein n=1 Tax=Acanthoscelides obtectus TaxID=200917 RepID=A0A9P0JY55_ACAOB|nr:unnamed protein product [Acanthoscelides obtectus]CAK1625250.1 hypothetical protein AOBTE_LOCUS3058 [Acanthoscelides obtectus]